MKYKIIEILIVIISLLALAALVGCKDEAEAVEPNLEWIDITFWEPEYPIDLDFSLHGGTAGNVATFSFGGDNVITCDVTREQYLKILYESMSGKEPTGEIIMRFSEPNDNTIYFGPDEGMEITICEKCPPRPKDGYLHICPGHDPNEILIFEAKKDPFCVTVDPMNVYLAEFNRRNNEPNEPTCEGGHGVTAIYCPECHGDFDFILPESNEPEFVISFNDIDPFKYAWQCDDCGNGFNEMLSIECACGKKYETLDILMKCVPTWPDYIELERDLEIQWPDPNNGYKGCLIHIEKGTKIYFKED